MSQITKPPVLDETAKQMLEKMDAANSALMSIAASQRGENWKTNMRSLVALISSGAQPIPVGGSADFSRTTSINISIGESTGITAASINEAVFAAAYGAFSGYLLLTYDGYQWKDEDGNAYILTEYGISVTGTAAQNDTLTINSTASTIRAVALGYDHDTLVNPNVKHGLTMGSQDCVTYGTVKYCEPQAIYEVTEEDWPAASYPDGMPAGNHSIGLINGNYDGGTGADGVYQFTTTEPVPIGGQIHISGIWGRSGQLTKAAYLTATVTTYKSGKRYKLSGGSVIADTEQVIESGLVLSEVGGSPSIGYTSQRDASVRTNTHLNFLDRIAYGSNRAIYSDMLQWANSEAAKGEGWWKKLAENYVEPQTNLSMAGFLAGFSSSFKDNIQESWHVVAKANVDGGGQEAFKCKIFLLSRAEVFMGSAAAEVTLQDGRKVKDFVYPFYQQFSDLSAAGTGADSNRIKYYGGTARYWFLRRPNASSGYYVYRTSPSGANGNCNASYAYGCAPAWVIG